MSRCGHYDYIFGRTHELPDAYRSESRRQVSRAERGNEKEDLATVKCMKERYVPNAGRRSREEAESPSVAP